jgi:hypothetical protein
MFGIDVQPFPVVKDDTKTMLFGIQNSEINDVDVLCGRGGATNSHPGNVYYRKLTDQYRLHYASVKKCYKTNVAKTVVKAIRNRHGRFLKRSGKHGMWYEIGDLAAKEKTSQTLREGLATIIRSSLQKDLRAQVAEAMDEVKKREFLQDDSAVEGEDVAAAKKQKMET